MKSPFTGKDMIIVTENRSMKFRKENFEVPFRLFKCVDTEEYIENEELASLNYNHVLNQYREKHNIPFPEEITAIREKYELSATKMSRIMSFGVNAYRNYENGEVPSLSNARLIQQAEDPERFKAIFENSDEYQIESSSKLHKRIEKLIIEKYRGNIEKQLIHYFLETTRASRNTGYARPSFEKFTEMVKFFAEKLQPWKTVLNKLLFYSDFIHYRKEGVSISGVQYRAIPRGPVPNNFQGIFEYLWRNDFVDMISTTFPGGYTGEKFISNSNHPFQSELFSPIELETLNNIVNLFKDKTTDDVVNLSHEEAAWIDNHEKRQNISYDYAFKLKHG